MKPAPQRSPSPPSAGSARADSPAATLLLDAFRGAAGRDAERLFFAPGRVNLLGAHLDYNGGPVLPAAIDRGTLIAAARRDHGRIVLRSTLDARHLDVPFASLPEASQGAWFDYPLGVLVDLGAELREVLGAKGGLELYFGGDLPIGAGLSSSASICVGTAFALDGVLGLDLPRARLVQAALAAERGFVGVQCGIMDPYAVGFARSGSLLWLECKEATYEHVPFDAERLVIGVADSGVRRELARGEFNRRVAECAAAYLALADGAVGSTCLADVPSELLAERATSMDPVCARRARHVVEEVARARAARAALERGDTAGFGAAMFACHRSLRDLFEVSTPELDLLVDAAAEVDGVLGSRLVGAGFGGATVVLLERGAEADLERHVGARYTELTGRAPRIDFFRPDGGPREVPLRG